MKSHLKKLVPITAIACGCLTSFFLGAHEDTQSHRTSPPPPPAGQSGDYERGTYREITPNAGPRVSNGADVFITADFIWWTAREDGLGYVASGYGGNVADPSDPSQTITAPRGKIHHPDWDWDPGFKVALGLNLGHDGWDIVAEYTWFHNHHNSDTKNVEFLPVNKSLYPMWNICNLFNAPFGRNGVGSNLGIAEDTIIKAKGDWDLHFNVIDLELARNYYISQYLALRPHVGLKGTWQEQHYKVTYWTEDVDQSPNEFEKLRMKNDQDTWGIGIRIGLDTSWYFTKNFSLYGDFALTAMWTDFDIHREDKQTSLDSNKAEIADTTSKIFNVHDDSHNHFLKPVMEFGLGLRWQSWFSDDDYHFSAQAGWEEQIWVNYNQLIHWMEESNHGDLTLHGLTVKFRFDF